jgi:hypothetical protein
LPNPGPGGAPGGAAAKEPEPNPVKAIPKNILGMLKNKFEGNPTKLADVEKMLGAKGRKLAPNEVHPSVADVLRNFPSATVYYWNTQRETLYLVFDGDTYTGGGSYNKK